jgi:hypothetical protein
MSVPLKIVAHDEHARESESRFRRRAKTQASFDTEAPAVALLCGLVAFGQIMLRRIDGHEP